MRLAGVPTLSIIALALALATTAAAQEVTGTLIVANRDPGGGSVSLFDVPTNLEIARIPIGPTIPHEVAVSPDGRWALTGEYGGGDTPGHRLVVIDVAQGRATGRIDLPTPSRPHSMAFLPDNRRAVATMEQADEIALVDVLDRRVIRRYPTGGREGHMVRLSPDGRRAYVTSRGAEGTLSVIDLEDEKAAPVVIPTGEGAEGLAVTPDGSEVWVVNRTIGTISVVDTNAQEVVATVSARAGAGRAEISAAGRVLVPNGAAGATATRYLTLYDAPTRQQTGEHPIGEGTGAFGIHIVGETAYVIDRTARTLRAYDLARFPTSRLIATSSATPDGLAYSRVRVAVMGE